MTDTECRTVTDLSALIRLGMRFRTIYADPPWRYQKQVGRGAVKDRYQTMSVDEITALPVSQLAAEPCHLWLWTTNAFLFECTKVFSAWGFVFSGESYVWVKPDVGVGNYLRNSHEFLLLAVRGDVPLPNNGVRSWGLFPRTKHSAKPEAIRRSVVEHISPGPRLELFGRQVAPGWVVFGNQVERTMFDADVLQIGLTAT